jgi:hypothetical protein
MGLPYLVSGSNLSNCKDLKPASFSQRNLIRSELPACKFKAFGFSHINRLAHFKRRPRIVAWRNRSSWLPEYNLAADGHLGIGTSNIPYNYINRQNFTFSLQFGSYAGEILGIKSSAVTLLENFQRNGIEPLHFLPLAVAEVAVQRIYYDIDKSERKDSDFSPIRRSSLALLGGILKLLSTRGFIYGHGRLDQEPFLGVAIIGASGLILGVGGSLLLVFGMFPWVFVQ